jgi:hypothetical protein
MRYYSNNRSLYSIVFISLLLACPIFFAASQLKMAAEAGDKISARNVLIVSNKKKFNDPVILKVAQTLRGEGNYVKLGFGTSLQGMKPDKYGAIIIINFIEDKSKDRSVEVFADESVQKKIVLLNAVGDYLASDNNQTSSRTVKSEKIALEVVEKTKIILASQ